MTNPPENTASFEAQFELAAGLDDVATEKGLASGWSFFVIPEEAVAPFAVEARNLLSKKMTEFHAKEFKHKNTDQCRAYTDFLTLIRRTAEAAPAAMLASTLNDRSWHTDLTSFAGRLANNVFTTLGITDQGVIDGAREAAPSLFTLQRLLTSPPSTCATLRILEADETTTMAAFAARTVTVNGHSLEATRLLAMLAESYRQKQFPQSPALRPEAINIVESSASFLVQAADVLGNFSMNYVIRNLGPTTAGRTKKAEIFESVFRDILPHTKFAEMASLSGTEFELALKQAGALTFVVTC